MEPNTFEHEMQKFDKNLRLRRANDGGMYFIERKTRRGAQCIPKPNEEASIDRWLRDRTGHVLVTRLSRDQISKSTLTTLREADMWQYRHSLTRSHASLADKEQEEREVAEAKQETDDSYKLQCVGEASYDRIMSEQGDVVYPGLSGPVAGKKQ